MSEKNAVSMHIQRFQGNFGLAQKTILFFCILSPPKSLKANQIQGLLSLDPRCFTLVDGEPTHQTATQLSTWRFFFLGVWIFYISPTWNFRGFFVECRVELFLGRNSLRIYASQLGTGNGFFFLIRSYWTVNQHHPWCPVDLLTSMNQHTT